MMVALIPLIYIISYYLSTQYTGGDQVHYALLYDALYGASILEIKYLSQVYVDGSEPLSSFVLWIGANLGLEKVLYTSFLNVILVDGLFLLARRNRVPNLMIVLLLTNFYVVVLMTAAERLKMAYIVLVLAMLFAGRIRLILLALTPLFHLQSLILIVCTISVYFQNEIRILIFKYRLTKKMISALLTMSMIAIVLYIFTYDSVLAKSTAYLNYEGSFLLEVANFLILSSIALYVTPQPFRMTLVLLPMIPTIFLIGGSRANMIAVTLVLVYLMEERKMQHPLIYLLMGYFSAKTIPFVLSVISTGEGF